jgi:hypothetical protein
MKTKTKKPAIKKPVKAAKSRMNQKDPAPGALDAKEALDGLNGIGLVVLAARLNASLVESDKVVLPASVVDHLLQIITALSEQIKDQFDL